MLLLFAAFVAPTLAQVGTPDDDSMVVDGTDVLQAAAALLVGTAVVVLVRRKKGDSDDDSDGHVDNADVLTRNKCIRCDS